SDAAPKYKIQLQRPDFSLVTFLNGSTELYFNSSGTNAVNRIVAPFDGASLPTGSYNYTATVTSIWSNQQIATTVSTRVTIQNEATSEFGAGWTLVGMQRLYYQTDGVLAIDG